MAPIEDLPLRYETPSDWAHAALSDPLALLNNHAHLEKKAAANALNLLLGWPGNHPPERWVETLTAIAEDEVNHLHRVARLLARRGGTLTRVDNNPYAGSLHALIRSGRGSLEILDRLIVSALIEARSCERFHLLALASEDSELEKLYGNLYQSEAGHYRQFLKLARDLPGDNEVESRWEELLDAEAKIIEEQPPGPSMHSGVASGV